MLIFDIGANIGNYAQAHLDNTDKIICVEANPYLCSHLRYRFLGNEKVIVVNAAVTSVDNQEVEFFISNADTISTMEKSWITDSRFAGKYTWSPIKVMSTTLDALIKKYGVPDLLKLDVEGHELAAIQGLSQKVPELCQEWAEESKDQIIQSVERLKSLGFTKFGYTEFDGYLDKPSIYCDWEDLWFEQGLVPSRKERWGMIYAK